MNEYERDDSPTEFSLARRRVLIGGSVLVAASALHFPALLRGAPVAETAFTAQFMRISHLLIDHRLDDGVGARLAAAMRARDAGLPASVANLLKIADGKHARVVEDFHADIPEGPEKVAAHAIIAAWYMGVVVDEPDAEVFAYESALMFKPTGDVMTIPTYAISGPNGWTADAPNLDVMPEF